MNTEPNPFGVRFALTWTLANILGVMVGFTITYPVLLHGHGFAVANIVVGVAVGACIGLAQGVVLFKRVVVGWDRRWPNSSRTGWIGWAFGDGPV